MGIPVLMYHAVLPETSLITVSPEQFSWQMTWLKSEGYRVTSLTELFKQLEEKNSLPERTVGLTFDDGLECLYEHAFPVLMEFGFSATIFLVTGYCAGWNNWPSQPRGVPAYRLLDWDRIREMDRCGIDFGAHTVTHPRLDLQPVLEARDEILSSKAMIEDRLGHIIDTFAYPYGRYSRDVREIVAHSFRIACSTEVGFMENNSDRYALPRVDVNYFKAPWLFRRLTEPISVTYLAARQKLRSAAGKLVHREWS